MLPLSASIFTGQYVHNHGLNSNESRVVQRWHTEHGKDTLQNDLHESGYKTAISGKYFNGWNAAPPAFDRWATTNQLKYYDTTFNVDGVPMTAPGYSTTFIGARAMEFLESFEAEDETPWFMQVSPQAPHVPSTPEPKYETARIDPWKDSLATGENDRSDKPLWVQDFVAGKARAKSNRASMLRSLMSVDDMVADVFTKLVDLGEADNTLAIFVSDNPFLLFDHGLIGKRSPYDQSVRVPLFVRWPGHIPAGVTDDRIVANIDIAPTVYAATGVEPSHVVDGQSLATADRSEIFIEYLQGTRRPAAGEVEPPRWHAIWQPSQTYIRYLDSGRREYYAPQDPGQLSNAYDDRVKGNEPLDQTARDSRIERYSGCAGSSCP